MVRIVVSEIEVSRRHALQRALCGEGFAVRTAAPGRETAALVESFNPDVVLLDMHRSVAQGSSPVGQIFLHHDQDKNAPLVFFTPAGYGGTGRVWTPSLTCCADGGLFGALPEQIRSRTFEHVRRVCLSLARCKHMMMDDTHPRQDGWWRKREHAVAA